MLGSIEKQTARAGKGTLNHCLGLCAYLISRGVKGLALNAHAILRL